jgi:hypothetical protein
MAPVKATALRHIITAERRLSSFRADFAFQFAEPMIFAG